MVTTDQIHEEALIFDGLFPQPIREDTVDNARSVGIDAANQTVVSYSEDFTSAIEKIEKEQEKINELDNVHQARSAAEIRSQDGLSVVFGFQNSQPLERAREPHRHARTFEELGVKIIQLTYNEQNYSGCGCTERRDSGLSDFGYEVIDALESNDIILDLSHVGPNTAAEAIEASSQPVIFSHANANGLVDYCRNISDELIKATIETAGTVGISSFYPMLGEDPTHKDFVDHIEYMSDLVGPENVAIGLDNGVTEYPQNLAENPYFPDPPSPDVEGLSSNDQLPNVTEELLTRGFTRSEIDGFLGENLLRVLEDVWGE